MMINTAMRAAQDAAREDGNRVAVVRMKRINVAGNYSVQPCGPALDSMLDTGNATLHAIVWPDGGIDYHRDGARLAE